MLKFSVPSFQSLKLYPELITASGSCGECLGIAANHGQDLNPKENICSCQRKGQVLPSKKLGSFRETYAGEKKKKVFVAFEICFQTPKRGMEKHSI